MGVSNVLGNALSGGGAGLPGSLSGLMFLGAGSADDRARGAAAGLSGIAAPAAWVAGFAGHSELDGSGLVSQSDQDFGGGLIGAHTRLEPGVTAGVFAGIATNRYVADSGDQIDTDFALGGLYGLLLVSNIFVDVLATGGWSESDSERLVVSNQSGSPGLERAHAEFESAYFLPSMRVGMTIGLGGGLTLIPAAGVRY